MECITCKTKMKCVSDVNDMTVRLDFLECPKCKSTSTIIFGENGKYIEEVKWKR